MFDYQLYLSILKRFGIKIESIYATEVDVLNRINLLVLTQQPFFTLFNDTIIKYTGFDLNSEKFYYYIQNYILYLLIESTTNTSMLLNCLTASLFFFISQQNNRSIDIIINVIKQKFILNSVFLQKFTFLIDLTASNLKNLGTDETIIDTIVSKIDLRQFF